jgi:dienelactone hydrolase
LWPLKAPANAPEPKATGPAAPRVIDAFNVVHLRFRDATGDLVPALLCTPKDKKGPFPLVIAVHGLTSHKGQVCWQVGSALAAKGFAILAFDLPCHGERPGLPLTIFDPQQGFANLHRAVIDVRQCLDLAETRPEIDHKAGITLVGYSLGSWISAVAGAADPRVKAMVLMVGGAFDAQIDALRHPQVAAIDVRLAIPHFGGRPLLLLNGKLDLLVKPESAKKLFAAAAEPKKQIWYDSGHLLPAEAYADAADWIDKTIRGGNAAAAKP